MCRRILSLPKTLYGVTLGETLWLVRAGLRVRRTFIEMEVQHTMARTRRKHPAKLPSKVAVAARQASGAGIHMKSHKQQRGNDRAALRKEYL
jgi:hypothetical protein